MYYIKIIIIIIIILYFLNCSIVKDNINYLFNINNNKKPNNKYLNIKNNDEFSNFIKKHNYLYNNIELPTISNNTYKLNTEIINMVKNDIIKFFFKNNYIIKYINNEYDGLYTIIKDDNDNELLYIPYFKIDIKLFNDNKTKKLGVKSLILSILINTNNNEFNIIKIINNINNISNDNNINNKNNDNNNTSDNTDDNKLSSIIDDGSTHIEDKKIKNIFFETQQENDNDDINSLIPDSIDISESENVIVK